jgi:hypothetical protein
MSERTLGLGPCAEYKHDHPPVRNVIAEHEEHLTLGQRVADRLAGAHRALPVPRALL